MLPRIAGLIACSYQHCTPAAYLSVVVCCLATWYLMLVDGNAVIDLVYVDGKGCN